MTGKTALPLTEDGSVDSAKLAAERDAAFRHNVPGLRAPRSANSLLTPRGTAEMAYKGTLLKGSRYAIAYREGPLIFERGQPVPINEAEFERLRDHVDVVVYADSDGTRWRRFTRRFAFTTLDDGPVDLPDLPDEQIA